MDTKLRWLLLLLLAGLLLAGCDPTVKIIVITPTPVSAARALVPPSSGQLLPTTATPLPDLPVSASPVPEPTKAIAPSAPTSPATATPVPTPTKHAEPTSLPAGKSGVIITTPTPAGSMGAFSAFDVAPGPALRVPRFWHTATRLMDGRILLISGSWARDAYLTDVNIFDPATGQTSRAAPINTPQHFHTATLLPDGRVFVIGGGTIGSVPAYNAEVYDPVSDTWTVVQLPNLHGHAPTATLMKNGRVLIVGGNTGTERVDIFDPKTNAWSEAQPLPSERMFHAAQLLEDGRVLIVGGNPPAGGDAQVYDPRINTWTATGPMAESGRWLVESIRLSDGRVLVAGGVLPDPSVPPPSTGVEIYDPASNTWTAAADLAQPRVFYNLVLLPTGQVLAIGGARDWDCCWTSTSFVREIELYDPISDQWRIVGTLPSPRAGSAAVLLPNGSVWVTGGRNDTTWLSDTWLISPHVESAAGAAGSANIGPQTNDMTFTRITTGDIVNEGGHSSGACWGDYDNDGYPDLFVANWEGQNNFLYHNHGDGMFEKITTGRIVNDGGWSRSCTWGDYDNDGFADLAVSDDGGGIFLYHNEGGASFTRVQDTPIAQDYGNCYGISWADYDNDGWLDLFVARHTDAPDLLYHNHGNGTFEKITTGPAVNDSGASVPVSWGDYDGDGCVDLFVGTINGQQPNFLYRNNCNGSFNRIMEGPIATDRSASSTSNWVDYDNDGDLDLFVGNVPSDGHQDNLLYKNDGNGRFTKITAGAIVTDGDGHNSSWADYDGDGDPDLFMAIESGLKRLYQNNGDGTLTRITTGAIAIDRGESGASGPNWADYDNDGDMDLFVAVSNGNNLLYRNNGTGNHWLHLKLIGAAPERTRTGVGSNRSAIGARVTVSAAINGRPVQQMQEVSGQTGMYNQNSLTLEFGLGDARIVESVTIRWPSGVVQTLANVAVNQLMTVQEPRD